MKDWRARVERGWCLRLMGGEWSELVLDGCAVENLHLWDLERSSQNSFLLVQLESLSCRVVSLRNELRWNSDVIRGRRNNDILIDVYGSISALLHSKSALAS